MKLKLRHWLFVSGFLIASEGAAMAVAPAPEARVEAGRLRGSSADAVESFLGIPFAAPPTGQ